MGIEAAVAKEEARQRASEQTKRRDKFGDQPAAGRGSGYEESRDDSKRDAQRYEQPSGGQPRGGPSGYEPGGAMYKMGFKTQEEYFKWQKGQIDAPPYVAIKTDSGKSIHLTRAEAEKLLNLSPRAQFIQMQRLGIIEKGSKFIPVSQKEWQYISATELRKQRGEQIKASVSKRQLEEYQKALKSIEGYKVRPTMGRGGDQYDISAMVKAGVPDKKLNLLFGKETIKQAKTDISRAETFGKQSKGSALYPTEKLSTAETIKEIALDILPGVGQYRQYKRAIPSGLNDRERLEIFTTSVLDALMLASLVGNVARGARAASTVGKGSVSAGARMAAIKKALKNVALAEVKAPYTMIRHPVQTAKTLLGPAETVLRPSKIPTASLEIRESTVRLPRSAFLTDAQAMAYRDAVTAKAVKGEKAIATLGNVSVELKPTALKQVAPVAIHATPDIRPFLEGTTIKAGREGGLFVAPNLHTRFTRASAFGEIPEGGIRGALIIRDENILSKLSPSGKIYKSTAEIEAKVGAGMALGNPMQVLITRDAAGEKLTLLVFGKPFTAAEIAKMKLIGTADTIKQLFINPVSIKGDKSLISAYDELNDIRKTAKQLEEKAAKLRKQGKVAEAAKIRAQTKRAVVEAERRAEALTARYVGATTIKPLSYVIAHLGDRTMFDRLERFGSRDVRGGVTKLTGVRVPRETDFRLYKQPPQLGRDRQIITNDGYRISAPPLTTRTMRATVPRQPVTGTPRVPVEVAPPVPVRPLVPTEKPPTKKITELDGRSGTDRQRRRFVADSSGAIAWRQGELGGKDVWHVIVSPYMSENDVTTVLGRKPSGATIVKGPESAMKTAQLLYGKKISQPVQVDIGIVDANLEPISGNKGIKITFRPDPLQKTAGDITIGKKGKVFPLKNSERV